MTAEITTTNMEEVSVVDAARRAGIIDRNVRVSITKKPCSPRALFCFPDMQAAFTPLRVCDPPTVHAVQF